MKIDFTTGPLDEGKQRQLSAGFESHSETQLAPPYQKERFDEACRGTGMGKKLMAQAEEYAKQHSLSGLWLWTQSWQAPQFYQSLGFVKEAFGKALKAS